MIWFTFWQQVGVNTCHNVPIQIRNQTNAQAITLTSDIPTWRIKCPQSRKNCRIYPTKCRINVLERKLLCPIIRNWFSAWIKPSKPRFIMGENGGCWQSWRVWSETLSLNCSNQLTLMPLFFSHVNQNAYLKLVDRMRDWTAKNHFYSKHQSFQKKQDGGCWWISERFVACCTNFPVSPFVKNENNIHCNVCKT